MGSFITYQLATITNSQIVDNSISFQKSLIISLLNWFKTKFFKWVDTLPCSSCGQKTIVQGVSEPYEIERKFLARVVEMHVCQGCNVVLRFPRYLLRNLRYSRG